MSYSSFDIDRFNIMGDKMNDFIWHWTNGNTKVFTRKSSVAEQAMKEGKLVIGKKIKPHILKY